MFEAGMASSRHSCSPLFELHQTGLGFRLTHVRMLACGALAILGASAFLHTLVNINAESCKRLALILF